MLIRRLWLVLLLLSPLSVSATEVDSSWASGNVAYSVNTASFSRISTHAISSAEGRFWTQYAASQWATRSGVPLTFDYLGDTTNLCSNFQMGSPENTVEVVTGCAPGDVSPCIILGQTRNAFNSSGLVEFDMCIYTHTSPIVDWELQLESIAPTEIDLVGVLVHEFGHALGLAHNLPGPGNGTMSKGNLGGGLNRYLFGDDIEILRTAYGSIGLQQLGSYWREKDSYANTWSSRRSMGGTGSFQPRKADIGSNAGGDDYVVSVATANTGDLISFKRAPYPLGTSATWSTYNFAYDSWVTPAITSNHANGGEFVVAWPQPTATNSSCGSMRFLKSTGAFASGNTLTLNTSFCTLLSPALEWVDGRNYYLLVWIDFDFATPGNTGSIMYSTSLNGLSWATATRTGLYALDTPGLACESGGECQLSYLRASSDTSQLVNRRISMSTSRIMSFGASVTKDIRLQREASLAWDYIANTWVGVYSYTTSYDWLTMGYGDFYSAINVANPIPTANYAAVGESAEHPPTLAGNIGYNEIYLFNVD